MIFPHTVTVQRATWDDTLEREKYTGPETVASNVKALIAPGSPGVKDTDAGPVDVWRDLIFLEPAPGGTALTIKVRDILIDDATDEQWMAVGPGNRFQDPTTFGVVSPPVEHHIEVEVVRAEWNEP